MIGVKFIHLGDVHLGVKPDSGYPWSQEREQEIWDSFRNIIDICNEEKTDLLLIAGDFFHKQPLVRQLKEVNYMFSTLSNTRVVIIAGNHDYISPRSNYIKFEWNNNVHMLMNEHIDSVYFEDINTDIYGLSYHQREIKKPILDDIVIKHRDRINILLAHGGTPTNIPFDLKAIESKGFDYVALGHIHKPQKLGERISYAGSIEPTDKTDIGRRGFVAGKIEKDEDISNIHFSFIPHSVREYINIELQIDDSITNTQLQDLAKETLSSYNSKDIFIITIMGYKDPDIKFELDSLMDFANVIEIIDKSIPNYDFEQIYQDNKDNIIGVFIKTIQESEDSEVIKTKALYYGIEALIYAKNNS